MRATAPVADDAPRKSSVSNRKRTANRANAAKSTGPKTDAGKAVSRLNALVHGVCSQTPVLPDEDPYEMAAFSDDVEASLRPRGAVEVALVGRIVSILWRMRRLGDAEEKLFEHERQSRTSYNQRREAYGMAQWLPPENEQVTSAEFLVAQFTGRANSALERLGVYEQRLDRCLHATLRQLQQLRKMSQSAQEQHPPEPQGASANPPQPAAEEGGEQSAEPAAEPAPAPDCASVQNEATAAQPCAPEDDIHLAKDAPAAGPEPLEGG